jgi:O-methyltransferase
MTTDSTPTPATAINLDALREFLTGDSYADPSAGPWWPKTYDRARRNVGGDWPATAFTMIGAVRLRHLQSCVEHVVSEGIPGDLIECVIWRGGAVMLMRAVLNAIGARERHVFAADSFCGLPAGDCAQDAGDPHHTFEELRVSEAQVMENFRRASEIAGENLADGVTFLPGWFKDTLPAAPIDRLAILRLDGDMYGSTMDCLEALYPKVSAGGFVVIDDWCLKGARTAVAEYAAQHGLRLDIAMIDKDSAYFRVPSGGPRVEAAPPVPPNGTFEVPYRRNGADALAGVSA